MARTRFHSRSEASVQSGKDLARRPKRQARWILAATILASSMAFIDGTVVNVALPFLQKSLNTTAAGVQWVVESYSLFLAALLLVGGSLGDRYGRRRVFLIGVTIFAASSIACGLSVNIVQLIMARAVQGIGGALLIPGSLAIISASFEESERGAAIGTWSGFSAITTAIGPVLGGRLVEQFSWRAVFFLNVPLAVAVVIISLAHVPESRTSTQRLDWTGAALATAGLGLLVFGLIESSNTQFSQGVIVSSLVGGFVCIALFIVNEARAKNAMMPLHLFRSHDFSGANLLTLFLYAALSGTFFFFTLNLIQVLGYSATAAGASLLPFVIIMFALSRWSGGLIKRFGSKLPLVIGPLIAAAGFFLFATPLFGNNYWSGYFPAMIVLGLGMAITVAPLTTTVMSSVSQQQAGVASGVNNAVSRTAGLLAIAVFGVIMSQTFSHVLARTLGESKVDPSVSAAVYEQRTRLAGIELPQYLDDQAKLQVRQSINESFTSGFRVVMFVATGLAVSSSLAAWFLIGSSKPTASKH